jgi:glycerol-3-phosphate O-acyltransferase / dihydroxyacetone phosphate acyltransferase
MAVLARLLIRVFFSGVEVEHGERLRTDRPTVLVADHRNGLVDGLLLMAALPRYPRFLGKSTLFRHPLLWPFLQLGGVVPVHRTQDGGSPDGNRQAFDRCHRLLERRALVAVFPEGISHDQPSLQAMRTGAARIALSAAAAGVPDVETVAATLVYDDKQRFRSRALVRVGVPRPAQAWMEAYRNDSQRAVRSLTDDLAGRLRHEGNEYRSWAEASELEAIADAVARPATALPVRVPLIERQRAVDALVAAGRVPECRAALQSLHEAYDSYRRLLDLVGLTDAQVAADYGSGRLRWDLARAVARVVLALPFAVVGLAVHAVPYAVVKVAGSVPDNLGMRATVKLLGSFFLFAATYVGVGIVVGSVFGAGFGVAAAVAAPMCGSVAVRLIERLHRIGGARAGYHLARRDGPMADLLRSRRAAVVDAGGGVIDRTDPPGP